VRQLVRAMKEGSSYGSKEQRELCKTNLGISSSGVDGLDESL